jgi:hypothetical protein
MKKNKTDSKVWGIEDIDNESTIVNGGFTWKWMKSKLNRPIF